MAEDGDMIYTVTFSPAVDYLLYLDTLRVGEIQRSEREAIYFSGKGINVSKVMHTLGVETTALGFLAGFTGRAIEDSLTADGIACDFCFLKEGNTRINVKLRHGESGSYTTDVSGGTLNVNISMKSGTETDINCQGPDVPEESVEELLQKLDALTEEDVVIVAGSARKSLPRDVYARVIARAAARGARTALDADGELLRLGLSARPYLVKPNREELSALLGRAVETDQEVLRAARELQTMGARNVLVSLGSDGAIFLSEEGEGYRMGVAKGTCVNSIGAGDSMLAGFLAEYLAGKGAEEALLTGTACGAATAFSEGLATLEEIESVRRTLRAPRRI